MADESTDEDEDEDKDLSSEGDSREGDRECFDRRRRAGGEALIDELDTDGERERERPRFFCCCFFFFALSFLADTGEGERRAGDAAARLRGVGDGERRAGEGDLAASGAGIGGGCSLVA